MSSFLPSWHLVLVLLIFPAHLLRADWADDVDFNKLKTELGASMPNGSAIRVTQVESPVTPGAFSPVAGSGNVAGTTSSFTGKTFTMKSGTADYSWHGDWVAQHIFGKAPAAPRYGMATGVTGIDVYEVNSWLGSGFLRNGTNSAPLTETSEVQSHAWIYIPTEVSEEPEMLEILRRLDHSVNGSNYVPCVGMNNDGANTVPVLMATAANVISVGLTSGAHSRGLTASPYDVPGRTKPEVVAPADFTSFATGMVCGAVTVLRSAATTTNAQRNETLRAVLLAGATKKEFPNWARTTARPLDAIYGAGEINLYHSYKILTTAEQSNSSTNPVALQGWDYRLLTSNSTSDYVLQIPASLQGASLSAVLIWNRFLAFNNGTGIWTPSAVPNLNLKLYKGTANPGTQIDTSDSQVDNLEHVWQPALTSGTYRLRITGDSSLAASASLAWRVTPADALPQMVSEPLAANQTLTFHLLNLVPSQLYEIQASTDLASWNTLDTITPTTLSQDWTSPVMTSDRHFFRLRWTNF